MNVHFLRGGGESGRNSPIFTRWHHTKRLSLLQRSTTLNIFWRFLLWSGIRYRTFMALWTKLLVHNRCLSSGEGIPPFSSLRTSPPVVSIFQFWSMSSTMTSLMEPVYSCTGLDVRHAPEGRAGHGAL